MDLKYCMYNEFYFYILVPVIFFCSDESDSIQHVFMLNNMSVVFHSTPLPPNLFCKTYCQWISVNRLIQNVFLQCEGKTNAEIFLPPWPRFPKCLLILMVQACVVIWVAGSVLFCCSSFQSKIYFVSA